MNCTRSTSKEKCNLLILFGLAEKVLLTGSQCDESARINTGTPVSSVVLRKLPVTRPYYCDFARRTASAMVLNAHLFVISRLNEVFRAPWLWNESDDNRCARTLPVFLQICARTRHWSHWETIQIIKFCQIILYFHFFRDNNACFNLKTLTSIIHLISGTWIFQVLDS